MDILKNINGPKDLKGLTEERLVALCAEIREYMVECCSKNPGHLGSSLGAVELAVALHYVYDTPADKLVWDVGHQAYAHKIITGVVHFMRAIRVIQVENISCISVSEVNMTIGANAIKVNQSVQLWRGRIINHIK